MPEERSLFRDFVALLSGQAAAQGATAVMGLIVVRALAPEAYARYALALATAGLAGALANFGLGPILTREISRRPGEARALLANALVLRWLLAALVGASAVAAAWLWPAFGDWPLVLLAVIGLFGFVWSDSLGAALTGLGRVSLVAAVTAVSSLAAAGLTVVAAWVARQPASLVAVTAVGMLLPALALALSTGWGLVPARAAPGHWPGLLGAAVPITLMQLAGSAFQTLDIYVISFWLGRDAVGVYGAALRLLGLLLLIPTAWSWAALPRFARVATGEKSEALAAMVRRSLWPLIGGSVAIALAITLLAEPVTGWLFGPAYLPAADVLRVLVWQLVGSCALAPYGLVLLASGHQASIALLTGVGGLIALAAAIIAAPIGGLPAIAAVKALVLLGLLPFYVWRVRAARSAAATTAASRARSRQPVR